MRIIEYFGPLDGTLPAYLRAYQVLEPKLLQTYYGNQGKLLFGKFKANIESEDALFIKMTISRKFRIIDK